MMADVGGHPRAFEFLLDECLTEFEHHKKDVATLLASNDSCDTIWSNIHKRIWAMYPFENLNMEVLEKCMADAFLEREVSLDDKNVEQLYRSSLITLLPTNSDTLYKISVPLIWFYVFQSKLRFSTVMKNIKPFLSPKVEYHQQFEKFVVDFNLLMNNLRVFREMEQISLEEQLRGAIFQNEDIKKQRIKLVEMNYCYSEKQYTGEDIRIKDRESDREIDWKKW
jgi:hypothetical protein